MENKNLRVQQKWQIVKWIENENKHTKNKKHWRNNKKTMKTGLLSGRAEEVSPMVVEVEAVTVGTSQTVKNARTYVWPPVYLSVRLSVRCANYYRSLTHSLSYRNMKLIFRAKPRKHDKWEENKKNKQKYNRPHKAIAFDVTLTQPQTEMAQPTLSRWRCLEFDMNFEIEIEFETIIESLSKRKQKKIIMTQKVKHRQTVWKLRIMTNNIVKIWRR